MPIHRSTIQLLRFHFSLFLLPVYLFALSQLDTINWANAILVFIVLHLFVYPASNGYNSYMDRDSTPIGGLVNPLQPTKQLFYFTIGMDIIAVILSLYISVLFSAGVVFYILASRAYSYRGIRLKKYPFIGFLTVFISQGALIFYCTINAAGTYYISPFLPAYISSLLIGALYPLTQIYQYEADLADGVVTISYRLGKKGSFIFSMLLFLMATVCVFILFNAQDQLHLFYLYLLFMLPVVSFFMYWMGRVWQNREAANFRNSLLMNLISTICTSAYFITLIVLNH